MGEGTYIKRFLNNVALTPVVASIILCMVVLVVGIPLWFFTYNVTNSLGESYYEDVKRQIDAISERFMVEHLAYNTNETTLHVWIYNYGKVNIEVDVYVYMGVELLGKNVTATQISSGRHIDVMISLTYNLPVGSELVIKVISRRQNVIYETYTIPAT